MSESNGHATNGTPAPGKAPPPIAFTYRNHRGEVGLRRVRPGCFRYGETEWHPGPQWLLEAFDVDKGADRTFAAGDILEWHHAPDMATRGPVHCLCGAVRPDCACPALPWSVWVRVPGDPEGLTDTGELVMARTEGEALAMAATRNGTGRVAVRPAWNRGTEELTRK